MSLVFRSEAALLRTFVLVCGLLLGFCNPLSATDVYVAVDGSNANSGTVESPWRTIKFGVSQLHSGDTLIIKGGTYTEAIDAWDFPSGEDDAHPTTIKGAPGETVILNGLGRNLDIIEIADRSYVTLDNLTLDGVTGTAMNNGIRLGSGGAEVSYITVKNTIIKNAAAGIYTGGEGGKNHHLRFQHLSVFHNGDPGTNSHGIYLTAADSLIEDCDIYDNAGHGIHIYGATRFDQTSRNIVRRNRIHGNGSFGLMLSSGSDNVAYDNVIYENGRTRAESGGFRFYDGALNNQFLNNTVYGNIGTGVWIQSGTGAVVINNISYWNSADNILDNGTGSTVSNNLTTAPAFLNASVHDFHLTAGSPAVDSGITLSLVNADMDGVPRPAGRSFDIGAYEYSVTLQPPLPPPAPATAASLPGPTGLMTKCENDWTFTVSWTPVPGAESYYLRIDDLANNDNDNWYTTPGEDYYFDAYVDTTFTGTSVYGAKYVWWVYAANSSTGMGPAAAQTFSCPLTVEPAAVPVPSGR